MGAGGHQGHRSQEAGRAVAGDPLGDGPALVIVLAALSGSWTILAGIVPAVAFVGALLLLHRSSTRNLAKRLHATPAASEPFTFVADATGTHDASATAASDLAWSPYTAVALDGDLIVLTLDGGTVRVLPNRSLASGADPQAVVDQIGEWIGLAAQKPMAQPGS